MTDDAIEAVARAGYECSEWGHKQPWDQNPWARKAWRACAAQMIAAMPEPKRYVETIHYNPPEENFDGQKGHDDA